MRVPLLERSVQATDSPTSAPLLRRPDYSVAEGVQQLGRGVGDVLGAAEKMRQQALAVKQAEGMTALEAAATARLQGVSDLTEAAFQGVEPGPGYLSTRGQVAYEKSAEVLKSIEKERARLVGTFSPEERGKFELRSKAMLEDYRRQVEGHAARQFEVAKADAQQGLKQAAKARAFREPDSPGGWATDGVTLEELGKLGQEKADNEATRSELIATRIDGFLARKQPGDLEAARTYFESQKERLGKEDAARVDHALSQAEKSAGNEAVKREAERQAQLAVEESRWRTDDKGKKVPTRYANPDAAGAALERIDPAKQPGLYEATQEEVARRLRVDREARAARNKSLEDQVTAFDNKGARPPANLLDQLGDPHDGNPDWIQQRRVRREREARLDAALAGKDKPKASALRTEQNDENDEARKLFAAELVANPDADPDEFLVRWAADEAKKGREVSADPRGRAALVEAAAKSSKTADTKEGAEKRRALADVEKSLRAGMKKKGQLVDEQLLQQRTGNAALEYDRWVEANGGKPLDPKQLAELEASALRPTEKPGRFWGTNKGPPTIDTWGAPDAGVPAQGGAGTAKSKLPPGRYKDKQGRTVIIDADGTKRLE